MDVASNDRPEILVTTASFGAMSREPWDEIDRAGMAVRRPRAAHPLSADQLAEEIGEAEGLIVGLDTVDASVFAAAPRLRVVAKHGVGVNNIDLEAAARAGVVVVNAPGTNATAVAELTWGLILAGARQVADADRAVRNGGWPTVKGLELAGRTLGIVGFGRIGQAVCRRAAAFDMPVVAHDPYADPEAICVGGARPVDLEECVATADVLCLHAPWTPGDPPLLDRRLIELMRPGAGLVNAARGELIDEVALSEALTSGAVAFAALDALAVEPPPADHPLLHAPHVVVTPHMGAMTDGANRAMGVTVVRDVARVLQGLEPLNWVPGSGPC